MGGVGSFTRENRTLHVAGLKRTANLEEVVTAHFAEFGELEAGSFFSPLPKQISQGCVG